MDKREIELAKQNILKDRRRRLIYLNKEKNGGKHVLETEMRLFSTLKNGYLIGLLVFLIVFGIAGQSILIALGLMLAIAGGAQLYLSYVFLPKRKDIKLNEVDIDKIHSHDFIKALEANKISQIIILVVLSLMIFLRMMDMSKPLVGLELEVARYSMIFFVTFAAVLLPSYYRYRKARRALKA